MVPTSADVDAFVKAVPDDNRRSGAHTLLELMRSVTGESPVMWGSSIVGFGSYRYRYVSGRSGDAPLAAFSVRRRAVRRPVSSLRRSSRPGRRPQPQPP